MPANPAPAPAPDWNAIAETFDRWLPYIQPVGDRLIATAGIRTGHTVLDVACGTGEPALSIARRFGPSVTVTGVDSAEAMIARAAAKAAAESLTSLSYRVMPAERLDLPAEHFDRVMSRFGVMLFDDRTAGAREMWRVLRPGGRAAIAVWGPLPQMHSIYPLWRLLPDYLPAAELPPEPRMTSLSEPAILQRLLVDAGWTDVLVEPFTVTYRFDNPLAYWDLNTETGLFKDILAKLSCHAHVAFKARALADIATYRRGNVIELPNLALIATAHKPLL
ncbi:MAG: methyltransferase domain-containing protein [Nitrospiria bacterium]